MKKTIRLIMFWLLSCIYQVNSQNIITYESIVNNNIKLKKKTNQIDSLIQANILNDSIIREISHKFSIYNFGQQQYSNAIKYGVIESNNFAKNNLQKTPEYSNCLLNLSLFYYYNKEYLKTINTNKDIIELNIDKQGDAYSLSGVCYSNIGDYSKAAISYEKAIKIFNKKEQYQNVFINYNNLINVLSNYHTKDNLIKRKKYLKKNILFLDKFKFTANDFYLINNNFALYYRDDSIFNVKKARYYYLKNLKKAISIKDTSMIAQSNISIGELFVATKNDSAIIYLEKASKLTKNNYLLKYININYAKHYQNKNELHQSLEYLNKTIALSIQNNDLDKKNILKSIEKNYTLGLLETKINLYITLHNKEQDTKYLEYALNTVKIADELIDLIKKNSLETTSKLFWSNEASPIYSKGVYCAKLTNKPALSLYFMEKNKALLLLDNTVSNIIKKNLPKRIIQKEKELKSSIYNLENLVNSNENDSIKNLLFEKKGVLEKFNDSIKKEYPNYLNTIKEHTIITLKKIQSNIKNNEVVITYIWNPIRNKTNTLFALLISKNKTKSIEINQEELSKIIGNFNKLLNKPLTIKNDINNYQKTAYNLFQILFPNQEIQDFINGKKLLILPDNKLQNIPFEALITQENSNHYLIYNNEVSYAYSMSFLAENSKVQRKPSKSYVGFAPINFDYDSLTSLTNSQKEVQEIKKIMRGTTFLNHQASKTAFINSCNDYNILHLATHADANSSSTPWIAFQDEKMPLYELYTSQTQADLVTLSACNTTLGEIANGEGVLSLSRGFFYSGANTVVSSLWKVDDKATSELMFNFYTNLDEHKTKSKALHLAKLDYLKRHSLSEQSPYYWASFVLVGDAGELHNVSTTNYWWLIFGVLVILAIILLAKRYKFKN